ncbi:hypothetical protein N665_0495s0014 [Sinapis alba]|nr:hypothetical protein N665_0495s0014 [Sinapis alba]
MAKQIIELEVTIKTEKHRNRAMKIVGGTNGVTSMKFEKEENLKVEGEEVDLVVLAYTLKKKVGATKILKVS